MNRKVTLAQVRAEAKRVYGDVADVFERRGAVRDELVVLIEPRYGIEFFGRSKAYTRRLALATLRSTASRFTPP